MHYYYSPYSIQICSVFIWGFFLLQDATFHLVLMSPRAPFAGAVSQTSLTFDGLDTFQENWPVTL